MKFQIFLYALLFLNLFAFAQKSGYAADLDMLNLKGDVSSMRLYYTYIKSGLANDELIRYKVKNDVMYAGYLEFNKIRMISVSLPELIDSIAQPINYDVVNRYYYFPEDIKKKKNYKYAVKVPYPVYDGTSLQLNVNKYMKGGVIDIEPQLLVGRYIYKFNNEGRVAEETFYILYDNYKDGTWESDPTKFDIWSRTYYSYNKAGRLVKQTVKAGETMESVAYISYDVHGTSLRFGTNMYRTFDYDAAGRLIEVKFFAEEEEIFNERYTYHTTKGYVEKVDRYLRHFSKYFFTYPAEKMTATYNEHGDITQLIFFPDGTELRPVENRYYEYEYDKSFNWIKCKLYLQGNKEEPTLIAERIIEYNKH